MDESKARRGLPLAAELAAGFCLLLFSNGRWIIPAAAWLAPLFLLLASRRLKSPWAPAGLLAGFFIASRVMLYGIIPSLLGFMTYLLTFYYALLSFLPYLADRLIGRRLGRPRFASTLVFPAALVVVEYANAVTFGDWCATAFSQHGNLPLMQIASVTGIWGVTFLVAWFPAILAWAIDTGWDWPKIRRGAGAAAAVYAAVFLFGGARLLVLSPRTPTVRVASFTYTEKDLIAMSGFPKRMTANPPAELPPKSGASSAAGQAPVSGREKDDLARLYFKMVFDRVRECAKSGAAVVFWAEGMMNVREVLMPEFVQMGVRTAAEEGVYLLMAIFVEPAGWPKTPGLNKAILISPDGKVVWDYAKSHRVPGANEVPGKKIIPCVDTPFGRLGAAICYDFDFPVMIRQAGRRRVDIMLDPSWDWRAIDPLHTWMAEARAVENGFALVRQTGEGLSTAVDGLGRPVASMDHFASSDRRMIADVPKKRIGAAYPFVGDLFAWLCLAGLVVAVVRGQSTRPTASQAGPGK